MCTMAKRAQSILSALRGDVAEKQRRAVLRQRSRRGADTTNTKPLPIGMDISRGVLSRQNPRIRRFSSVLRRISSRSSLGASPQTPEVCRSIAKRHRGDPDSEKSRILLAQRGGLVCSGHAETGPSDRSMLPTSHHATRRPAAADFLSRRGLSRSPVVAGGPDGRSGYPLGRRPAGRPGSRLRRRDRPPRTHRPTDGREALPSEVGVPPRPRPPPQATRPAKAARTIVW